MIFLISKILSFDFWSHFLISKIYRFDLFCVIFDFSRDLLISKILSFDFFVILDFLTDVLFLKFYRLISQIKNDSQNL